MCYLDLCPFFNCVACQDFLFVSCYRVVLHVLDVNLLYNKWFASIFSNSIGCLFILLIVSFKVKKFNFDIVHFFPFVACAFGVIYKK